MISLVKVAQESLRTHKLTRDIAWSMGSFIILAISGIVINIAVTAIRDAAALGVFNIAYAVYIVTSQFAVWGIHYSVLRYSAFYKDSPEERGAMLLTALVITFVMGGAFAGLTYSGEPLFFQIFDSEATAAAIKYAALGLLLFPLNKALLAYLNGMREMKAFSILQGMRYLTVMVVVTLIALSELNNEYLTLGFLVAELLTALSAASYIWGKKIAGISRLSVYWVKQHYIFGSKGLLGGMFTEVNSRVDVLLIGFFLSDRVTGIYSFAAMLVDGLYHVLAMVRINFNPVLVASVRDHDWKQAINLREQAKKYILPITFVLSIVLLVAYYVLATWIVPGKGLMEGIPSLLILLVGLNIISMFVPFDNLMVVSGHPGYQATQQMLTVIMNALLAALLIPALGIEGAAIGTAAGYTSGIIMLLLLSHRMLGWDLLKNTVSDKHKQSKA
jgi:O-antigen/teichoic acid export membrane protein